jgi:flagellar protein FliL
MAKDEAEIEKNEEKASEAAEETSEGEGGEDGGKKKGGKKKKIIILVVILMLLAGGGGGAFFFMKKGSTTKDEEASTKPQTVFMELDEFLVNLSVPDKRTSLLKLKVSLELPNLAAQSSVTSNLPRIRDDFNVYLRELRPSDLEGSAGTQRLKEELIIRANKIISPHQVSNILFSNIIVQ